MSDLSVTDAILQRGAVREFSDRAVPVELVGEILELAGRSPSGSNLQPWKTYALAGAEKDRLCEAVLARAAQTPDGDSPDILVYPPGLSEPWRTRREECGERMYTALDIARDDPAGRFEQRSRNLLFFGAPVGLIVTMDRALCESQVLDIGLFVQNILLLAQERGLATCPQASWTMWSAAIREVLEIEDTEMIMLGISLGYAAADAPINHLSQSRLTVNEFASFRGFES